MPPPSNLLYVHITLICVAFYTRALLCIGLHLAQSFAVFVISIVTFGLVCMSSQFCHLVLHAAVKTCLKTAFNLFRTVAQSNNACLEHGTLGCGVKLLRCDCTGTRQLSTCFPQQHRATMHVLNMAAVHWQLVIAHLDAEWIFIDVIALVQDCFQLVLNSKTEQ